MRFRYLLFCFVLFTFLLANANNRFTLRTIVIDAGHGGKDPGAIGPDKIYEKDASLAVALKLGSYIQKNYPDVKVIYTRKTDVFVELHERAEIANRVKADLFIAIHCNSSPNADAYGTSSYILGLHRTEANLEVAKRENSVINLEENQDKNYEFNPNTPEGHIIMSMKQNAFLDQSIDFAAKIENELESYANRKSLGVKQAGFYVLYKTTMPSVLAEIGFISNPEEEKYLNSARGQDQIASGLFNAFRDYKNQMEGGETTNKPVTEEVDNIPVTPEKRDSDVAKNPITTSVVKETVPVNSPKLTDEPIKEVTTTPVAVPVKETPKEETSTTVTNTDTDVITLTDGTKIKKPIATDGGGGKAAVTQEVILPKKPLAATDINKSNAVESDTKAIVEKPIEKATVIEKATPKTVKTEVKPNLKTKSPEPNETVPENTNVVSNRNPLVPLIKAESGTIFRIQLFALKGPLKDYEKYIRLFKVMGAEELGNGVTRYYGAKTNTLAEAKKYHAIALNNGFKDSYIVGFTDGKRMSFDELKLLDDR